MRDGCSAMSPPIAGRITSRHDRPRATDPRLRMRPGGLHLQPGPERRRRLRHPDAARRSSPRSVAARARSAGALDGVRGDAGVRVVPGFGAWAYSSAGTLSARRVPDARRRLPRRRPREPRRRRHLLLPARLDGRRRTSSIPRAICSRRRGAIVGEDVPIVVSLDLHGVLTERMLRAGRRDRRAT